MLRSVFQFTEGMVVVATDMFPDPRREHRDEPRNDGRADRPTRTSTWRLNADPTGIILGAIHSGD